MAKPTPLELFAFYHLGLDRDFAYRFRNLTDAAHYFQCDIDEINRLLTDYRFDPQTTLDVPYKLPVAHADAQIMALTEPRERIRRFVKDVFAEYMNALVLQRGGSNAGMLQDDDYNMDFDDS